MTFQKKKSARAKIRRRMYSFTSKLDKELMIKKRINDKCIKSKAEEKSR